MSVFNWIIAYKSRLLGHAVDFYIDILKSVSSVLGHLECRDAKQIEKKGLYLC